MFAAGAQRLADYVSKEEIDAGNLYPQLTELRDISLKVPSHPIRNLESCLRPCLQLNLIEDYFLRGLGYVPAHTPQSIPHLKGSNLPLCNLHSIDLRDSLQPPRRRPPTT